MNYYDRIIFGMAGSLGCFSTPPTAVACTHGSNICIQYRGWGLKLSGHYSRHQNSGKKRAHKLKKIPGTPAGCSWDTPRDKQGSTGQCPGDFLLFTVEKRTEKGIFAGTPAGCPRDTRPSRRFPENLCAFFLCAFSAP